MILKYNDEYGSSRGNALYSGNLPPTASAVGGKLRYRVALASLAENEILVIKFGPPRNMENERKTSETDIAQKKAGNIGNALALAAHDEYRSAFFGLIMTHYKHEPHHLVKFWRIIASFLTALQCDALQFECKLLARGVKSFVTSWVVVRGFTCLTDLSRYPPPRWGCLRMIARPGDGSYPDIELALSAFNRFRVSHPQKSFEIRMRHTDWNYRGLQYILECHHRACGLTERCQCCIHGTVLGFRGLRIVTSTLDVVFGVGQYSVFVKEGVTCIGREAFDRCTGLTSVTFPESLTSIGRDAFSGCAGLTSVTFPESLTSIGESAFNGCTGLTSVAFPESLTSIGEYAFEECGLTSVTFPEGLTSIGERAFWKCLGLTSVAFPESLTSIGDEAFSGCTGLTSVTFPEALTSIGWSAFQLCSGLTSVAFPEALTSIGRDAFMMCTGLTSVDMSQTSMTSIGRWAFCGCRGLTSVTFPEGLTSIGKDAFQCCRGLTSVTFPEALTSIGSSAFWMCTGLTSVTFPEGVTCIGREAFNGCTGLISVTFPEGLMTIRENAFNGCNGITSVTFSGEDDIGGNVAGDEYVGARPWRACIPQTSYDNRDIIGLAEQQGLSYDVPNLDESFFESLKSLLPACRRGEVPRLRQIPNLSSAIKFLVARGYKLGYKLKADGRARWKFSPPLCSVMVQGKLIFERPNMKS